jgi:DNA-binding transcriptional regulator/RsmH inhibitor MraZ
MALLRELEVEPGPSEWQHWIVAVENIGRISLPVSARRALGTSGSVQAVSRDRMLVLHTDGPGASLPMDQRGRLVLPAWFRGAVRSSGSVLVGVRSTEPPTVVLAPIGILDALMSSVVAEVR